MGHIRICEWVDCTQDITERPPQTRYCAVHIKSRRAQLKKAYDTKHRPGKPPRPCEWEGCAEAITARSPLAKYCPAHQSAHSKKYDMDRYYAKRGQDSRSKGGAARPTLRYVRCSTCKEEYAIPFRAPDPLLCAFCQDALKRQVAEASSEEAANVKRLGKARALSGFNVQEKPTGYYIVYSSRYPEGQKMTARMVI